MRALTKLTVLSVVTAVVALPLAGSEAAESGKGNGPFGLDKIIAFYKTDPELKSPTVARAGDWRECQRRGGIVSQGVLHYHFLQKSVEAGSDYLAKLDFGDNPNPVIDIDEFGWDFDGGIDQHTAAILKAVQKKRPELKIAIWQMRARSRRS